MSAGTVTGEDDDSVAVAAASGACCAVSVSLPAFATGRCVDGVGGTGSSMRDAAGSIEEVGDGIKKSSRTLVDRAEVRGTASSDSATRLCRSKGSVTVIGAATGPGGAEHGVFVSST